MARNHKPIDSKLICEDFDIDRPVEQQSTWQG